MSVMNQILKNVTCKYCIKCVFCDEDCRNICWTEFHQWECFGMQANLWYDIGIAFPAMRALIQGAKNGLQTLKSDYPEDMLLYGNDADNYGYFNKLVTNICKMENVLPLIISATIVTLYLKKHTNFFSWLKDQNVQFDNKEDNDIYAFVNNRIVRHIAQLQCNSSVISHSSDSIACAIYPSISMMNHSCKPNIEIQYIREMAMVKAKEVIGINEEIFNCYGIDYRFMDKEYRQELCENLYYFKCKCSKCNETARDT